MKRRPLMLMLASAPMWARAGAPLVFPMHEPGRESHWRYLLAVLKLAAERADTDHLWGSLAEDARTSEREAQMN